MVAPNRKIANTTSYSLKNSPNPNTNSTQENSSMNPNDSTRGCAVSQGNSATAARSSSNELNFSKSSVDYTKRREAQSWVNQIEVEDEIVSQSPLTWLHKKTADT